MRPACKESVPRIGFCGSVPRRSLADSSDTVVWTKAQPAYIEREEHPCSADDGMAHGTAQPAGGRFIWQVVGMFSTLDSIFLTGTNPNPVFSTL